MGLIDPKTQARLDAERASPSGGRRLAVANLEVGDWGVLEVDVDQVHPGRPFQRKRGGEGMVGRVTLRDASGAIDMVLWDDENRLAVDGPLAPGTHLVIRGATVKAGWKGGLELGLGSAELEPAATPAPATITGTLVVRSETALVGDPPQCKATAILDMDGRQVTVICWEEAIKSIQGAIGATVCVAARPHPALEDHYIAGTPTIKSLDSSQDP